MFTQSDLKTEKNNVNLHLKLHIVHDIPHCKFYLKNNTHSSLSGKLHKNVGDITFLGIHFLSFTF